MKIGELECRVPVVQGGMGVGVSLHNLAGSVAACGGIGVISTAQIGFRDPEFSKAPIACNLRVLKEEIAKARVLAKGGILGVNIMVVTQQYEDYVKAAVEAGIDIIISGAGLPMKLPELVKGSKTKIAPIVSGVRALKVIMNYWKKKYDRVPDMVVIEGPRAGGHLGFNREEIDTLTIEEYDKEIADILQVTHEQGIPTVVAGGIYTREDWDHYKEMGADGVQMATRFVTTYECDASLAYKETYLHAKKEDIVIVNSPVGMPGRAIHNSFLDRVKKGERFFQGCKRCISTCNPAETPYCITQALINAVEGRVEEGLLFCGSNAYLASELEHVQDIMKEFA